MDISVMRDHLISLYPGSTSWRQRVNQMPDNQVIAIYKSKMERAPKPRKLREEKDEFPF